MPEEIKVKESRAAKMLFKKVNSMINKMDTVLSDLEKKEKRLKEQVSAVDAGKPDVDVPASIAAEELVRIDELMSAIKKVNSNRNFYFIYLLLNIFIFNRFNKYQMILGWTR